MGFFGWGIYWQPCLVGLERQQLGHDQVVGGLGGHGQGVVLVVPAPVLEQQVQHAHVPVAGRLHQAGERGLAQGFVLPTAPGEEY